MSQYIGTDVTLHEYTVLGIIIISQPDTKIIKEKKKTTKKNSNHRDVLTNTSLPFLRDPAPRTVEPSTF